MRKMLNPAFSQRGLLAQEAIIGGIIDKFVGILGQQADATSEGLNMTKWYEMNSFDILGEMAFGESFHSLDTGKLFHGPALGMHHRLLTNIQVVRQATFLGRHRPGTPLFHHHH